MIGRVGMVVGIAGVVVALSAFALEGGRRSSAPAVPAPNRQRLRKESETDPIGPALMPNEWANLSEKPGLRAVELARGILLLSNDEIGVEAALMTLTPRERHQAAALCLNDQACGFTWDDVDLLRTAGSRLESDAPALKATVDDLAERIAALLPPRGASSEPKRPLS